MVFSRDIISYFEEQLKSKKINYVKVFNEIKKNFKGKDVVSCFKYILENKTDNKLLYQTIKEINSTRYLDSFPFLIEFILKPEIDSQTKVLAIKAISNYKNTKAVSALLFCLNDKNSNYKIRLAAAEALGKIGDKNAFEALGKVAVDEEEKSTYVKESAVAALGMLGDNRALDVFSSILSSKEIFLEKFTFLKEKIIEAMSNLDVSKDKKALEILKASLLETNANVRISAIESIMNLNIEGGFNLIYERLKFDCDIEVKKNALIALYNLNGRKILDEVIEGDFEIELKEQAKNIIEEYE